MADAPEMYKEPTGEGEQAGLREYLHAKSPYVAYSLEEEGPDLPGHHRRPRCT